MAFGKLEKVKRGLNGMHVVVVTRTPPMWHRLPATCSMTQALYVYMSASLQQTAHGVNLLRGPLEP